MRKEGGVGGGEEEAAVLRESVGSRQSEQGSERKEGGREGEEVGCCLNPLSPSSLFFKVVLPYTAPPPYPNTKAALLKNLLQEYTVLVEIGKQRERERERGGSL